MLKQQNTKATETEEPEVIEAIGGFDLGFNQTKIYSNAELMVFPSFIGNPSTFNLGGDGQVDIIDNISIKHAGSEYYVGKKALKTENARLCIDTDKTESENEQVIFKACLGLMNKRFGVHKLKIVTGLPVEDFVQQGLKERLIENMIGEQYLLFNGEPITVDVTAVKVIPQAAGAYFAYLLDENGNVKPEHEKISRGTILVFDIGYKTTDIIVMTNGVYDSLRSTTIQKGMRDVHRELLRTIRFEYGRKFNLIQADEICKQGYFDHKGDEINIIDLIADVAKPIAASIINEANAIIGEFDDISKIIGTGGTMEVMGQYFMNAYEKMFTIYNSTGANGEGYYKYGMMEYGNQ